MSAYCLRRRTDLLLAFGAALVAAVATAALPLVLRHVVDGVAGGGAGSLLPWIALLAGLGAIRFGASFTRRYRSGRLSLGVRYDLRKRSYAARDTRSVAAATRRSVARSSEEVASSRSRMVVAHRLTTAARADRVVVLDDGTVVESGTHTALLAAHGTYHRLWEAFRQTGNPSPAGGPTDHPTTDALVKENAR